MDRQLVSSTSWSFWFITIFKIRFLFPLPWPTRSSMRRRQSTNVLFCTWLRNTSHISVGAHSLSSPAMFNGGLGTSANSARAIGPHKYPHEPHHALSSKQTRGRTGHGACWKAASLILDWMIDSCAPALPLECVVWLVLFGPDYMQIARSCVGVAQLLISSCTADNNQSGATIGLDWTLEFRPAPRGPVALDGGAVSVRWPWPQSSRTGRNPTQGAWSSRTRGGAGRRRGATSPDEGVEDGVEEVVVRGALACRYRAAAGALHRRGRPPAEGGRRWRG
jgi:hypothetical protein